MIRKILNKEEADKKKRKNQLLIGIVLIGLMVVSTAGYSLIENKSNNNDIGVQKYNGLTFVQNGNLWQANINGQQMVFQYLPEDVKNISVSDSTNGTR